MQIAIFAGENDQRTIRSLLEGFPELQSRCLQLHHADHYDAFYQLLIGKPADAVVVACDGAEGMEGVMLAKRLLPSTQVIWFSDDKGFGAQAFRLDCAYFSCKPINERVLRNALKTTRIF